jgi:hypothetical protein
MTKIIPANKARQGLGGRQVLTVLIAALLLSAVVWAGVELYGDSISDNAVTTEIPAG